MSEWGAVKVTDELRKYYNVAKAIEIYDVAETEADGYQHCNGKCKSCNICKSKTGGDCYFILHGAKAKFPIPDSMRVNKNISEDMPGFYKFGGNTINGINLNYCKANGIGTYDGRVRQLLEIWKAMERGDLTVYKNGYIITA